MARRDSVAPTEIFNDKSGFDKDARRYEHPAFGQISASRVYGGNAELYGTDFTSNGYVEVRIKTSQLARSLSHDWHFAGKELISVWLSNAQWATFVSAMNIGEGVPCTIDHINWETMPGIAVDRRAADTFKAEMSENQKTALDALNIARAAVAALSPKGKANEAVDKIDLAIREVGSNSDFVASSFDKHVETKIEHAKVEVHAYMHAVVSQAGIAALANMQRQAQIAAPVDDEPDNRTD